MSRVSESRAVPERALTTTRPVPAAAPSGTVTSSVSSTGLLPRGLDAVDDEALASQRRDPALGNVSDRQVDAIGHVGLDVDLERDLLAGRHGHGGIGRGQADTAGGARRGRDREKERPHGDRQQQAAKHPRANQSSRRSAPRRLRHELPPPTTVDSSVWVGRGSGMVPLGRRIRDPPTGRADRAQI